MLYDYFESTPDIESFLDQGDIDAIRGIITGIINRDPTFATKRYEEIIDYISGKCDVWDVETVNLPGEYEWPETKWDKEYFWKQLAWLSQNFTKERVERIKIIGKKVYANERTLGKEEAENFHYPISQMREKKEGCRSGIGKKVVAILVAIIIVATVIFLLR